MDINDLVALKLILHYHETFKPNKAMKLTVELLKSRNAHGMQ